MSKFIFNILISFYLFSFSVSICYGQDTLTVVAVGEAEKEKEGIGFSSKFINSSFLNARQSRDIKRLRDILISDFDFYRHLFRVDKTNQTRASYSGLHFVDIELTKVKNRIYINTILYNQKSKSQVFSEKKEINFKNITSFSHEISHNIYKVITGRDSIFKSKIVFVSDRTSRRKSFKKEVYIMDFDGARKQRLTFLNSLVISPSLSHDNSKILFSVIEGKWIKSSNGNGVQKVKNLNLHMLNLKTNKTKLISSVKGINSGAIFDRDGENIYLTLSYLKNADIFKMNLKTRKRSRITNHYSDDVDPHINASGTLLTFLSGRPGKAMIYTMDPSGVEKSVKRISYVGRFNASPRFNPSGEQIVFSSWVDNRFDIYRIDSNGRNLVRLTKDFGSNEEPWFSPDGEFIVFTSQRVITRKRAVQDVYIMNKDGEIIKKITQKYGKVYTPRWSN